MSKKTKGGKEKVHKYFLGLILSNTSCLKNISRAKS